MSLSSLCIHQHYPLPGFELCDAVVAAGAGIPHHRHERASMCFITRGALTERRERAQQTYAAPSFSFYLPQEQHRNRVLDQDIRFLQIELEPSWMARMNDVAPVHLAPLVDARHDPYVSLGARLYDEVRHMDDLSPLAIEGLLLELLAAVGRAGRDEASKGASPWLRQALDLIQDEFQQPHSLDGIARTVDVHPAHLARTFKAHTGRTVGEQIRHTRVAFARRRLLHSDDTLAQIALAAGFSDQSHFSRVFKRLTGMTPGTFRSLAQPA